VLTLPAQHAQDPLQPQHQQRSQLSTAHAHEDQQVHAGQQALQAQQQQQSWPQELEQLAQLDEPKIHWLAVVLGIGVVNILGLQAVLKLLQASKDSKSTLLSRPHLTSVDPVVGVDTQL
jgi:hypothetical protein